MEMNNRINKRASNYTIQPLSPIGAIIIIIIILIRLKKYRKRLKKEEKSNEAKTENSAAHQRAFSRVRTLSLVTEKKIKVPKSNQLE